MTGEQRAELRRRADKVAAQGPLFSGEVAERLAILLQPGIEAVTAQAERPSRTTAKAA